MDETAELESRIRFLQNQVKKRKWSEDREEEEKRRNLIVVKNKEEQYKAFFTKNKSLAEDMATTCNELDNIRSEISKLREREYEMENKRRNLSKECIEKGCPSLYCPNNGRCKNDVKCIYTGNTMNYFYLKSEDLITSDGTRLKHKDCDCNYCDGQ
jgi:hypothetical protein